MDDHEARIVLDALFPRHLERRSQCRKPAHQPDSWVEVDELQAQNYLEGQFVPTVRRRVERAQNAWVTYEYEIVVDNCQDNMFVHLVYATFVREELGSSRPKPAWRCECHPLGGSQLQGPACPTQ